MFLVPPSLRGVNNYRTELEQKRKRNRKRKMRRSVNQMKYQKNMEDPLQSFSL